MSNKYEYKINGMDCADCALHVEANIKKISGIKSVEVNFLTGKMSFDSNADISYAEVDRAVKNAGYILDDQFFQNHKLYIKEMDCADEAGPVEKALSQLDQVKSININLIKQEVIVEHAADLHTIIGVIKKAGFTAVPVESEQRDEKDTIFAAKLLWTVVSGLALTAGFLGKILGFAVEIQIFAFAAAIITGGFQIARRGYSEAVNLRLGMNALMTIAVIGAMLIGEWSEGAMVIFLFSLAQLLEYRSMEKARKSISVMMDKSPKYAAVKQNGNFIKIAVEEVTPGMNVLVKPGEKIPVDGKVITGSSSVDQSAITGESILVEKNPADLVFAGSINQHGVLEIESSKSYKDTTLSRIIHLVEKAQSQKAKHQTFIERFSQYYTPVVFILAILIATVLPIIFSENFIKWFYRSLVLLVIACPCALVLSTPITIVSGLTNAIRKGILIKGGIYLEKIGEIKVIAFDKTGTVTTGNPRVTKIIPFNGFSEKEIVSTAASLESHSEHLLSKSILNYAKENNILFKGPSGSAIIPGKGVKSFIGKEMHWIGNSKMLADFSLQDADIERVIAEVNELSQTAILVGTESKIMGIILVGDQIRHKAAATIQTLKTRFHQSVAMLTGDNAGSAAKIASEAGIDNYFAELLPDQKVEKIRELKSRYGSIAMVGDGINDAPALAAADIGIAMGKRGADVVLETADITLMKDDLQRITDLMTLSKKTVRLIKQNIFIALFLKFIFLGLAIPGLATLWMAVFADMGASLIVIFNGMRALKD